MCRYADVQMRENVQMEKNVQMCRYADVQMETYSFYDPDVSRCLKLVSLK